MLKKLLRMRVLDHAPRLLEVPALVRRHKPAASSRVR
jgi:hypothetical protein